MEPLTKNERRGVFQAYNLTVLSGAFAWHAAAGVLTAEVVRLAVIALQGTVMGAWLGLRAYGRLSEVVLALSGLTLLWTRL